VTAQTVQLLTASIYRNQQKQLQYWYWWAFNMHWI